VKKPHITYAQVDGEYMQIVNPTFMKIGLSVDLPRGKINSAFKAKSSARGKADASKSVAEAK